MFSHEFIYKIEINVQVQGGVRHEGCFVCCANLFVFFSLQNSVSYMMSFLYAS